MDWKHKLTGIWNKYGYTNFHELNVDYFIKVFTEIFEEWETLYNDMLSWKDSVDERINTLLERTERILATYDEWVSTTQANTQKINILLNDTAILKNKVEILETKTLEIYNKVNLPTINRYGEYGYVLMTKGNENTEWIPRGTPSNAQVEAALNDLLQTHPEWRATVPNNSLTINKLVNGTLGYVTPEMYGYDYETMDDCTTYVTACINAIKQGDVKTNKIVFTSGVYVFGGIILDSQSQQSTYDFEITIFPDAEIKIKEDTNYFFSWGRKTNIILNGGGKVNGFNTEHLPAYLFAAYVNRGQHLIVDNVEFYNIKKYAFYVNELGGTISVRNCFVHDMRYKTDETKPAEFFHIAGGQENYSGTLTVTNNKFIENTYENNDFIGGACAFFISDVVDASQEKYGNDSTAIFENNYFEGLSDPTGPSYTLHIYYDWKSVLITNNIFKHYYENAIGLKDSSNITVQNNVFVDGLKGHTSGRAAYIGSIDIQSSDHTPTVEHANYKIIANTFQNAPIKNDDSISDFIHIRGLEQNNEIVQYANNVIISDNIFENGNKAIWTVGVNMINVNNNKCANCGIMLSAKGAGRYNITNNNVENKDSSIVGTNEGMENCDYIITNNTVDDKTTITSAVRLFYIRSVKTCIFTNNNINTALSTVTPAEFTRYGTTGGNIADLLVNDNMITGNNKNINYGFDYIDGIRGLIYGGSSLTTPINKVNASGRGTCILTDANAKYYISRAAGKTTSSWREITVTVPST